MKSVALAVSTLLLAAPALAQQHMPQDQQMGQGHQMGQDQRSPAAAEDPMAAWKPPKVTREAQDRREIAAFMKKNEQAWKKGDVQAAAALIDFPVLMVTDDSKGEAMAEMWNREKWVNEMEPFFRQPMPEHEVVTHKPQVFLMSDSLASVDSSHTMTHGGKKVTTRSSMLLIRTGGEWRTKAMVEGGWGDMMGPAQAGAPAETTTGTGTGSEMPRGTTRETPRSTTE
jgi:hypothetical protein